MQKVKWTNKKELSKYSLTHHTRAIGLEEWIRTNAEYSALNEVWL